MKAFMHKALPVGTAPFWFILLSICFLAGSVLGTLAACAVGESSSFPMVEAVVERLETLPLGFSWQSFWSEFIQTIKLPLAVFLSGFCLFGNVMSGGILFIEGMYFSFSVTSFLRIQGMVGLLSAVCLCGVPALFLIPVLLLLGIQSSVTAVQLWHLSRGEKSMVAFPLYGRRHYFYFIACLPPLVLSGICDAFLAPWLLRIFTQ